jgi:hypothetical protein
MGRRLMLLLLAAVLIAVAVLAARRRRDHGDLPAQIVTAATRRLPADRRDWADALVAELAAIRGRGRRWAFAAGASRVALLPPSRRPGRVRAAAAAGLALTAVATLAAIDAVPGLAPFIVTLSLLLSAYVTIRLDRLLRPPRSPAYRAVVATAVVGLVATVAALVAISLVHPGATADRTHVLSILVAFVLTGFLAAATSQPPAHAGPIWRGAMAGSLALGAATVIAAAVGPGEPGGISPLFSPVGVATSLIISVGVAVTTGSRAAGTRAGLLTALLAAPIQFAIAAAALLRVHDWRLTSRYDRYAYPHSGYPDIASYMISDSLGGHLISGMLIGPLVLGAVSVVGATIAFRARAWHSTVK